MVENLGVWTEDRPFHEPLQGRDLPRGQDNRRTAHKVNDGPTIIISRLVCNFRNIHIISVFHILWQRRSGWSPAKSTYNVCIRALENEREFGGLEINDRSLVCKVKVANVIEIDFVSRWTQRHGRSGRRRRRLNKRGGGLCADQSQALKAHDPKNRRAEESKQTNPRAFAGRPGHPLTGFWRQELKRRRRVFNRIHGCTSEGNRGLLRTTTSPPGHKQITADNSLELRPRRLRGVREKGVPRKRTPARPGPRALGARTHCAAWRTPGQDRPGRRRRSSRRC